MQIPSLCLTFPTFTNHLYFSRMGMTNGQYLLSIAYTYVFPRVLSFCLFAHRKTRLPFKQWQRRRHPKTRRGEASFSNKTYSQISKLQKKPFTFGRQEQYKQWWSKKSGQEYLSSKALCGEVCPRGETQSLVNGT